MSRHLSRTVYVGNLPGDIHEREVKHLFMKYGHITRIDLKVPPRPPCYAFVVFNDALNADDAICGCDGYDFDGCQLRVEAAHVGYCNSSSRDRYSIHNNGQGGRGISSHSEYRVLVNGLPSSASCQDLKDHMRKAGDVCFSQVVHDGRATTGIVDYTNCDDMKYAIKKLDGSEFQNAFSRSYVRVREYDSRRDSRSLGRDPSHYRGRRYSRSRRCSRSRSYSPGHSQSKFPKGKSSQRSPARLVSRSRSRSRSCSLSRPQSRPRSPLPLRNKSPKKHSASRSPSRSRSRSKSLSRMDNLIMEAISSLNQVGGSNETRIANFIEDHHGSPSNFKESLSARLKSLTSSGKLIKVKKYRIAPTSAYPERARQSPVLEGRQNASMNCDRDLSYSLTQSELDFQLAMVMSVSAQEAATFAEVEALIEEAAEAYVAAAGERLKGRNNPKDGDPCF